MRNYRIVLFAVIALILAYFHGVQTFAQIDIAQIYGFGGAGDDWGKKVIVTSDGGYLILSNTGLEESNDSQIMLTKLNAEFQCEWSRLYGGTGIDQANGLIEAANGNFLFCGFTNNYQAQSYDGVVYRVKSNGDFIWTRTYGSVDWDFFYDIKPAINGGYVLCGKSYSFGNGDANGWVVKIGESGVEEANLNFGSELNDSFYEVLSISDNEILAVGQAESAPNQLGKAWTILFDLTGSAIWNDIADISGSYWQSVKQNGEFIFQCGNLHIDNYRNGMIRKLDLNNETLWFVLAEYNGDYVYNDLQIANQIVFLSGYTNLFGQGGNDGMVQQWNIDDGWYMNGITFGSIDDEECFSFLLDGERSIVSGTMKNNYSGYTNQSFLFVYPDLSYMPNFTLNWIQNDPCISMLTDVNEAHVSNLNDVKKRYFNILGQEIDIYKNNFKGIYSEVSFDNKGNMVDIKRRCQLVQSPMK